MVGGIVLMKKIFVLIILLLSVIGTEVNQYAAEPDNKDKKSDEELLKEDITITARRE